MGTTLQLVLPGLFGPWVLASEPDFPWPRLPALECLLARAQRRLGPPNELSLALHALFQAPPAHAALSALADGLPVTPQQLWVRADPVHLRADLHQIVLYDARQFPLSCSEAQALAASLNQTFADDGLQLQVVDPQRWYWCLPADTRLHTSPLAQVHRRDIRPHLPDGAALWRPWLTEVQMALHQHPLNQQRAEQGLPEVNSLWLWGEGQLPSDLPSPAWQVYSQAPLARGLARCTQCAVSRVPEHAGEWLAGMEPHEQALVVLDQAWWPWLDEDMWAWEQALLQLERQWFSPLLQALRERQLQRLIIHSGGYSYHLERGQLKHFWRRTRSIKHYPTLGEAR